MSAGTLMPSEDLRTARGIIIKKQDSYSLTWMLTTVFLLRFAVASH
jgi:hypothetical protein